MVKVKENFTINQPPDTTNLVLWDPLAKFIDSKLGWDWPQLLILTFILYGPIEKLLIPAIFCYLNLKGKFSTWTPHYDALLTGFVVFPFFFAFYLWLHKSIGKLFKGLVQNKTFDNENRFAKFIDQVQKAFNQWKWSAFCFTLAIIIALLCHFILWGPKTKVPPWFGQTNLPHRLLALVMIGFVGYAVSQIIIRIILTIFWLRRLWNQLGENLIVHPYHVDSAGGLGAIGKFALSLSYFIVGLTLFGITSSTLYPLINQGKLSLEMWNPLLVLIWLPYLIFVPLSLGFLLWPPHKSMLKKRNEQLSALSNQLDKQIAAVKDCQANGKWNDLPGIHKKIESLKTMRTLILEDFPIWPLDKRIRRQLHISTFFPIIHFLLTLLREFVEKKVGP